MSDADRKRWQLIAAIAVAAVLNLIATETHDRPLGWVGFVVLFAAILLFVRWRRAALAERRATFSTERRKPDEPRSGPDQ